MRFKVGQKVVCIASEWFKIGEIERSKTRPVKNEIYTILQMEIYEKKLYLKLEEVSLRDSYNSGGFRPLDYDLADKIEKMAREDYKEKELTVLN